MPYKVFVIGYPHYVGGAGGELLHTIRLWRQFGVQVSLIPAWGPPSTDEGWPERLEAWGIKTVVARELHLREDIPDLPGSIVAGFCNPHFVRSIGRLKVLGCKTVYAPLMCWSVLVPDRQVFMSTTGFPDAMIYQSEFQARCLRYQYKNWGYNPRIDRVIRGAFSSEDWPYKFTPRKPDDTFNIIRLARPDEDKWASNYYTILEAIKCPTKRVCLMGIDDTTRVKLGRPIPPYVHHFASKAILPVQSFYEGAHIQLCTNGPFRTESGLNGTPENAPMVARESACAGVPIIAPNAFGWPEIIEQGVTGLLADNDTELSEYATLLAHDEPLREELAINARDRLITELSNPEKLWSQWNSVFSELSS